MNTLSDTAAYVLRFINQTNRSVFLTGKAGTGKTTLLREIIRTTHKNTVVVAPTGIAALNAGGGTIHSMFQLPFAAFIPDYATPTFSDTVKFETRESLRRHFRMNSTKRSVIRNMELLVIDEVMIGSTERQSEFYDDRMSEIIVDRYAAKRATIVTANHTVDELTKAYPRMMSRLVEMNETLVYAGKNHRDRPRSISESLATSG